MPISEMLLTEFDHEVKTTRRTLERMPEHKPDWKPHAKSMALGRLAGHVADLVGFASMIVQTDSLDLGKPDPNRKPLVAETRKQVLEAFDGKSRRRGRRLPATSDERWGENWKLTAGGQKFYDGPRIGACA